MWVGGGGALRALEINRLLTLKNHTISMITGNFPGARSGRIENMQFERIGFGKYYLLSRLSFALLLSSSRGRPAPAQKRACADGLPRGGVCEAGHDGNYEAPARYL